MINDNIIRPRWLICEITHVTSPSNLLCFHCFSFSGTIHGPYGGNGGIDFEAKPPIRYNKDGKRILCYLGWISGQSDQRLDAISFHWKCPIEPSMIRPLEESGNQEAANKVPHPTNVIDYTSNSLSVKLTHNIYSLFLSIALLKVIQSYFDSHITVNILLQLIS